MNAGHVYVLAFDNGTVKVGQTQNATRRVSTHKSTARGFGLTVTDEWVSPLHAGWRANEDALKAIAAGLGGTPTSQEYFSGVDFAAVVEKAQALTFAAPEPEPSAPSPAQATERLPQMSAHERAIRNAADELAARMLLDEVEAARALIDEGGSPDFGRDGPAAVRLGIIMQLILDQEAEVRPVYEAVVRRLGPELAKGLAA